MGLAINHGDTISANSISNSTEVTSTKSYKTATDIDTNTYNQISEKQTEATSLTPTRDVVDKNENTANINNISTKIDTNDVKKQSHIPSQETLPNNTDNQIDSESIHTNTHANEAAFDSVYLNDEGQLHVEGWHAADDSDSQQSAWMIVYDATTNREI
ncbi:hypothetical protein, partial [Ligilactobacillus equi]|uniref:hypothetical protein n=1 Tax=Ligilactobacillus equi TaxID=137357 RepID=UPI0012E3D86F